MALAVKNLPANAGDCRFDPWVGKTPWRRKWQPTPVLLPGKFHEQRSLGGCSPWVAQSQTGLSESRTAPHHNPHDMYQHWLGGDEMPRASQIAGEPCLIKCHIHFSDFACLDDSHLLFLLFCRSGWNVCSSGYFSCSHVMSSIFCITWSIWQFGCPFGEPASALPVAAIWEQMEIGWSGREGCGVGMWQALVQQRRILARTAWQFWKSAKWWKLKINVCEIKI